jgi:hypothetical protein
VTVAEPLPLLLNVLHFLASCLHWLAATAAAAAGLALVAAGRSVRVLLLGRGRGERGGRLGAPLLISRPSCCVFSWPCLFHIHPRGTRTKSGRFYRFYTSQVPSQGSKTKSVSGMKGSTAGCGKVGSKDPLQRCCALRPQI